MARVRSVERSTIAYVRVSTEEQTVRGASLAAQEAVYHEREVSRRGRSKCVTLTFERA